jgi:hypothetical protein
MKTWMKSFWVMSALISIPSFATSRLTCTSTDGKISISSTAKNAFSSEDDTDLAEVKIEGRDTLYFNAHPFTLRNNLFFANAIDFGALRNAFRLSLGEMNTSNFYPGARLLITIPSFLDPHHHNTLPETLNFELNCSVSADYQMSNVCKESDPATYTRWLLDAATTGSVDRLEQAFVCGANLNAVNTKGCSAMMLSVGGLENDCLGTQNETPTYDPLSYYRTRYIVNFLLYEGASSSIQDFNGESITHKAVRHGFYDLVDSLKRSGANLDLQDSKGMTALMNSAATAYYNGVQALVTAGADLLKKDLNGNTAYELGVRLPAQIRDLLNPEMEDGLVIQGSATGCSPLSIHIPMGQLTKITLKSNTNNMFLMTSPGLGLNLMSAPNGKASQLIHVNGMGTYPFQCGIHGGTTVTGQITVTM